MQQWKKIKFNNHSKCKEKYERKKWKGVISVHTFIRKALVILIFRVKVGNRIRRV
jgi:hypothetical protein